MTTCDKCFAKDAGNTISCYKEAGYSFYWKNVNEWRSTWGFFGIKIQIKEVKISTPPESSPMLIYKWKTVIII